MNILISFIVVSAAVFFFVVKPVNFINSRRDAKADSDSKVCNFCLSEVPIGATRCKFCTSELTLA